VHFDDLRSRKPSMEAARELSRNCQFRMVQEVQNVYNPRAVTSMTSTSKLDRCAR